MMPFLKCLLAFLIIDASLRAKAYADFAASLLNPQDFQKGSSLPADTCVATEQEAMTERHKRHKKLQSSATGTPSNSHPTTTNS